MDVGISFQARKWIPLFIFGRAEKYGIRYVIYERRIPFCKPQKIYILVFRTSLTGKIYPCIGGL